MNFFKLYIGDYQRDTGHLTIAEHGAYQLMLQTFYATEKPLPKGKALHLMLRANAKSERDAVDSVVKQFWNETPEGLVNARALLEIGRLSHQRDVNREIGKRGGRPKRNQQSGTEPQTESVSQNLTASALRATGEQLAEAPPQNSESVDNSTNSLIVHEQKEPIRKPNRNPNQTPDTIHPEVSERGSIAEVEAAEKPLSNPDSKENIKTERAQLPEGWLRIAGRVRPDMVYAQVMECFWKFDKDTHGNRDEEDWAVRLAGEDLEKQARRIAARNAAAGTTPPPSTSNAAVQAPVDDVAPPPLDSEQLEAKKELERVATVTGLSVKEAALQASRRVLGLPEREAA